MIMWEVFRPRMIKYFSCSVSETLSTVIASDSLSTQKSTVILTPVMVNRKNVKQTRDQVQRSAKYGGFSHNSFTTQNTQSH